MSGNLAQIFWYTTLSPVRMGLVLPEDLVSFRNYPPTSVSRVVHLHNISKVWSFTQIYITPDVMVKVLRDFFFFHFGRQHGYQEESWEPDNKGNCL